MRTKLTLLCLGAVLATPFASAQIVLHDFAAFESPNTFFVGDWELNGDPIGTHSPRASFAQGAGFYTFAGGSNSDSAAATYFFNTPINIAGYSMLDVSAQLVAGNTAPNLTITLFDSLGESAFAVVSPDTFAGSGFTTISTALTFSSGFNASDLSSFQLSGNIPGGSQTLSLTLDQLSVTAVPEASTYGALAGVFITALILARRLRRLFYQSLM